MTKADEIVALLRESRELLREIRDALVPAAAALVEDPDGCGHPDDRRISLKAMRTQGEHWVCGACGYVQRPRAN